MTTMANESVIVTEDQATRVITLRRPAKKNAITQEMYRDMSRAIDTAQDNRPATTSTIS